MKKTSLVLFAKLLLVCIIGFSCNSKSGKEADTGKKDSVVKKKKEEPKPEPEVKYERPPIINIVDTVGLKRIIAFAKDTAANLDRMRVKLARTNSTKVAEYIKKNNLKMAGAPVVWYKKQRSGYSFEGGLQVNKKGAKSVAGIQVRELGTGKVVVAHFYGPYDLIPQGYEAVKEWMKDNKKIAAGAPYEIYVTNPIDKNGKTVDPYKVQTDIIFPIR